MLNHMLSEKEQALCRMVSEEWLVKAANAKNDKSQLWALTKAEEWERRANTKLSVDHNTYLTIRSLMKIHSVK